MTDHDIHGCGRSGSAIGVLCAFLGVATAGLILLAIGFFDVSTFPKLAPPIVMGLVGLFVGAGFFGRKAGVFLCKRGNDAGMNVLIGVALAFGSMAIAIMTGALSAVLVPGNGVNARNIETAVFFIAVATGVFGAIPATLLGVLYGFLLRSELRRLSR